jgi:TonB-linked SusC/RagA family outer membrane protein
MKTKIRNLITLLLMMIMQYSFAQDHVVSGVVSDSMGPVSDISVTVKGTSKGTITDFDGKYSINAKKGDVLVFSHISYDTVEKIVGNESVVNVMLVEGNTLDEVVITALGISRDKKSLGYSTQKVGGGEVNTAKETNFINSLSGKVAGLDIKKSNKMGGSTNILIRGFSSLTGNNQPLFVVDGVPISNDNTNTNTQKTGRGGYDYGNAASDISPDDIESINVLKGGAATALYGTRAGNGVIIITTKKGSKNDRINVSVSSSFTVSSYDKDTFVKYQNEYGAGYGPFYGSTGYFSDIDMDGDGTLDLVTPSTEDASYGAQFDPNLNVYQWDSWYPELPTYLQPRPWQAAENDPSAMFEVGYTAFNSFSIDGGGETMNFKLGYTNLDQKGIMPNSKIKRNNFDFYSSYKFSDKLSANLKAAYVKTEGLGRYGTGYDAENLMGSFRQWYQVNVDVLEQKDAYFLTRKNITWNPNDPQSDLTPIYWDNPYWTRYENYQDDGRNRIFGHFTLNYEINDWLNATARVTLDNYKEFRNERNNVGSVDVSRYARFDRKFNENNYDFMLNFDKDLSDKINIRGVLGSNLMRKQVSSILASTNGGLIIPGLYSLSNSVNSPLAPDEDEYEMGTNGYYINTSLGYDNTFFLEGSYRYDIFSTLPRNNDGFDYYSLSGSLVFSKLLKTDLISFGKLRFGWAKTGNGAPALSVYNTFTINPSFGGQPLTTVPNTSNNPDLKNETNYELEGGLEMTFAKSRAGFDLSLYKKNSVDQLMPTSVSTATGFTSKWINAGEIQNKGIELSLFGYIVKNENFSWRTDINWSKNENLVVSLNEGLDNLQLASLQGGVSINATVGEPYGTIKGTDLIYDDNGSPVVKPNGYYETTSTKDVIGNINPDWKGGINNRFTYKNLSLNFLVDMQKGGDVFLLDTWYGYGTGLYDITAGTNDLGNPLRDPVTSDDTSGGVILDGVQGTVTYNSDGTYTVTNTSPNNVRAYAGWYANPWGWARAANKQHVYDAGYIKLREVAIAYKMPKKILKNSFFRDVTFTLTGRNLWIIDKSTPYTDPESGISSGNVQGYQSGAYPSTKDYGLNVKLQF